MVSVIPDHFDAWKMRVSGFWGKWCPRQLNLWWISSFFSHCVISAWYGLQWKMFPAAILCSTEIQWFSDFSQKWVGTRQIFHVERITNLLKKPSSQMIIKSEIAIVFFFLLWCLIQKRHFFSFEVENSCQCTKVSHPIELHTVDLCNHFVGFQQNDS